MDAMGRSLTISPAREKGAEIFVLTTWLILDSVLTVKTVISIYLTPYQGYFKIGPECKIHERSATD